MFQNRPDGNMACVRFRSGLKLFVVRTPRERAVPDYALLKRIHEITPERYAEVTAKPFSPCVVQHFFKIWANPEADRTLLKLESSTSRARVPRFSVR